MISTGNISVSITALDKISLPLRRAYWFFKIFGIKMMFKRTFNRFDGSFSRYTGRALDVWRN